MPVEVGQEAPDFTLKDQDRNDVTLSSFRGQRNVVVVFYPFTFTARCEGEICALRDDMKALEDLDAQVLAVNCDSLFAHKKWSDENDLQFPVLTDFWPHGETARAYGVFNEDIGAAERATFVVDRSGVVRAHFQTPISESRSVADYKAALADLT